MSGVIVLKDNGMGYTTNFNKLRKNIVNKYAIFYYKLTNVVIMTCEVDDYNL